MAVSLNTALSPGPVEDFLGESSVGVEINSASSLAGDRARLVSNATITPFLKSCYVRPSRLVLANPILAFPYDGSSTIMEVARWPTLFAQVFPWSRNCSG